MKIVKIYGGLGNQMFQYAFARRLAIESGEEVLVDTSAFRHLDPHNGFELERVFGLELRHAELADIDRLASRPRGPITRLRRKYLTKRTHVIDKKFGYQPELLALGGDVYYEGYWQSEKYFEPIAARVREELSFKSKLCERNEEFLRVLPRPAVSLHVRRGDYLKHPNLNICTPAYYNRAIVEMKTFAGIRSIVVLSEDAEYCRSNIDFCGIHAFFVDWNRGEYSWEDMAIMKRCDHHIIANSSFSWWGAWLNPSESKRVIAPAIWNGREIESQDEYYKFTFKDVVPKSWSRLEL